MRYLYSVENGERAYPGRESSGCIVKDEAQVVFRYKAWAPGFVAKIEEHSVKCNKVAQRGRVPLPPGWASALHAMALPGLAADAAERARLKETRSTGTHCEALGVAKRVPPRTDNDGLCPGASVTLHLGRGGARGLRSMRAR